MGTNPNPNPNPNLVERDVAADGGVRREAHELVGLALGRGRELEARARAHGARLLAAAEQQVVHAGQG